MTRSTKRYSIRNTFFLAFTLGFGASTWSEAIDYSDGAARIFVGSDNGDERAADLALLLGLGPIVSDAKGNIYVVDEGDNRTRRIDARTRLITTVVGNGARDFNGDGLSGTETAVGFPRNYPNYQIAVVPEGHIFFPDSSGRVRRWDAANQRVFTVAGGGSEAFESDGHPATSVDLGRPRGLAIDDQGTLYIATIEPAEIFTVDLGQETISRIPVDVASEIGESPFELKLVVDDSRSLFLCYAGTIYRLVDNGLRPFIRPEDPDPASFENFSVNCANIVHKEGAVYFFVGPHFARANTRDQPPVIEKIATLPFFFNLYGFDFLPSGDLVLTAELDFDTGDQVYFLNLATGGLSSLAGSESPESFCSKSVDVARVPNPQAVGVGVDGRVYVVRGDRDLANVLIVDEATNISTELELRSQNGDGLNDASIDRQSNLYVSDDSSATILKLDGTTLATRELNLEGHLRGFIDQDLLVSVSNDGSLLAGALAHDELAFFQDRRNEICLLDPSSGTLDRCMLNLASQTSGVLGLRDIALDEKGSNAYLASENGLIFRLELETDELQIYTGEPPTGFQLEQPDINPLIFADAEGLLGLSSGLLGIDYGFGGSLFVMTRTRIFRVDLETGSLGVVAGSEDATAAKNLSVEGRALDQVGFSFGTGSSFAADPDGNIFFSNLFSREVGTIEVIGSSIRLGKGVDGQVGKAISTSENRLAIGIPDDTRQENGIGSVSIYRNENCKLILEDRLTVPDGFDASGFGAAVSLEGDRLAVGASRGPNSKSGLTALQAAIFERLGQKWIFKQALRPIGNPGPDDEFGAAVALDGDQLIIGAPGSDEDTGAVHLFELEGDNFSGRQRLETSLPAGSRFGSAVSMDAGKLAAGAPGSPIANALSGAVGLYDSIGSNLDEIAMISAPSPAQGDEFGAAVSVLEGRLLVGSPGADGATGTTFLYDFSSRIVTNLAELVMDGLDLNAQFGRSVALDQGEAYVGAPGLADEDGGSGALFGFDVSDLSLSKGLVNPPRKVAPRFFQKGLGAALSVAGGRAFGGAPRTGNKRGDALAARLILNLSGVAGLWFSPDLEGEGFNVVVSAAGTVVYYYGYKGDGSRLWLVSETRPDELEFGETVLLRVFDATRGSFAAPSSSADALQEWGNLRLTVLSNSTAAFELNGVEGNKTSHAVKLLGIDGVGAGLGGLWFDPNLAGEGYNVISSSLGTVIYYYGSTAGGERLWLVSDTIGEMFSAGEPKTVRMFEARGGTFDFPIPSAQGLRNWGELTVQFNSCTEAVFELAGVDGNKESHVVLLAGIIGANCSIAQ